MRRSSTRFPFAAILLLALAGGPAAGTAAERPASQVVIEAGWARAGGDLGSDFNPDASPLGFGAGDGLELGFRWRYRFSPHWSLAPGFHVVDYRNYRSTDPSYGDYSVAATSLRYTAELMYSAGHADASVRPFVGLAVGWFRNRVVGLDKTLTAPFDESVNTPGATLRAGLRIHSFEFCAVYGWNRFETWRYFDGDDPTAPVSYDWGSVGARVGWILPFSEAE